MPDKRHGSEFKVTWNSHVFLCKSRKQQLIIKILLLIFKTYKFYKYGKEFVIGI